MHLGKKLAALLIALVLLFALASCGSSSSSSDSNSSSSGSNATTSENTDTDTSTDADDDAANDTTVGDSDNVIKIGHICDLTGTEALTGIEARSAMEFAIQYVNDTYGFDGYSLEVITGDAQSNADSAADAARKLIQNNGVVCIFGPTQVGDKASVAAVCADEGIPVIFYNPTPEDMITGFDWVLGASGTTPQMPSVMADYCYNDLGYTNMTLLTKDDTGGYAYANPFIDAFEALGGTITDAQYAPSETTSDFAPYMTAAANSGAEAIICWDSGTPAISLWTAWYDAGLNETMPIVALFSGAFTDSFILDALDSSGREDVSAAVVGTYSPMSWAYDIDTEENQAFVEAYKEAHDGANPIGNNLAGAATQVILLFSTAVNEMGGTITSEEDLRDTMLALDITGPEGRTVFENGSHAATKDIYVTQVVQLDDGTYNYGLVKEYDSVPVEGLS